MKTKHSFFLFYLLVAIVVTGCVNHPANKELDSTATKPDKTAEIQVVRYGRYTLVEVDTSTGQKDLMEQIIDVKVPLTRSRGTATVADAMRYVLRQSGYQLCKTETVSVFDQFTLPAAHYQLGPMPLKDALSVLAGTGWNLTVDHAKRTVCFIADADKTTTVQEGQSNGAN